MRIHRSVKRGVALVLLGMLAVGCASMTDPRASGVVFHSFDLPESLEPHQVIHGVEEAFARTLQVPLKRTEGSVQSPLPASPPDFRVEYRHVRLDQLGVVLLPRIVCPENMAMVSGYAATPFAILGLQAYAGCVYQYAGGYHVHIVAMETGSGETAEPSSPGSASNTSAEHASLLAKTFVELVPGARLVRASTLTPSDMIVRHPADSPATKSEEQELPAAVPLLCLGPAGESLAVHSQPGGGTVLKKLGPGTILTVAEPVDSAYFRVSIEGGHRGWIHRSDVRRLLCPIG